MNRADTKSLRAVEKSHRAGFLCFPKNLRIGEQIAGHIAYLRHTDKTRLFQCKESCCLFQVNLPIRSDRKHFNLYSMPLFHRVKGTHYRIVFVGRDNYDITGFPRKSLQDHIGCHRRRCRKIHILLPKCMDIFCQLSASFPDLLLCLCCLTITPSAGIDTFFAAPLPINFCHFLRFRICCSCIIQIYQRITPIPAAITPAKF
ncbi:unknown [Roseburia sp. CAG:309]|nr:unknown [Roseburia sp. CAG:309]